uniref:Major facilitator superfamily (MFS) profile domain-containing protein n=1 Tax=Lutzomyia longipalpis TaxID=7200 RepID=A0A1B0CB10_LUTLO
MESGIGISNNPSIDPTNESTITQFEFKENERISYEDALTKTTFGKFNYFAIFICGMSLAAALLESMGIGFVIPVAQCDLQLTHSDKGVLSAVAFIGIIVSSHLWGFLADTMGRRTILLPSLFGTFISTVFSSLGNNFWTFAVLRFLSGFFISGASTTVYSYLSEFHNPNARSRAIMAASSIFGLGGLLMPAIAWLVMSSSWSFGIPLIGITYKPWRLFLVVSGLPDLICAISFLFLPESPKYLLSQGRQEEAIAILQSVYHINTGKKKENLNISAFIEEQDDLESRDQLENNMQEGFSRIFRKIYNQTAPLFMGDFLKRTVIACILQFGILFTANGMYLFFPDILNRIAMHIEQSGGNYTATICDAVHETRIDIDDILASNDKGSCDMKLDISAFEHTLILEVLYALGFILIGFLINAVGKLAVLVSVFIICGLCGIAVVFTTIPLLSIYLYAILLLCGLAVPVVNASTVDLFPTHLRAMSVSISLMMGRIGSVFGSNLIASMIEYNCGATFLISGISLIYIWAFKIHSQHMSTECDDPNY